LLATHMSMARGYFSVDSLRGVHVLVVDHEPLSRDLLRGIIHHGGALVTTAASGAEAFGMMQLIRPDALVVDVEMPDGEAYRLIRQVRALKPERGGVLPAIALSSRALTEEPGGGRGFDAHLTKPFSPWDLCKLIATLTFSA